MNITEQEFLDKLKAHIKSKYGTQGVAAKKWGCSISMVSYVCSGDKKPTQAMLEEMGYKRIDLVFPTYEEVQ